MLDKPTLPPPAPPPGKGSFLSLALAGVLGMGVFSTAVLLSAAILGPFAIAGGLLVGSIFLVIAFHYVVWGWWLGSAIRREAEAEQLPPER